MSKPSNWNRHPHDPRREQVRRAILAVAKPGRLLPRQSEIAKIIGCHQPKVSVELDALREEWRIVTRPIYVYPQRAGRRYPQLRLLVVEVPA